MALHDNLLTLTNISLDYGEARVLRHINLQLDHAEVHAIVGEHGAGKSSLGLLVNGILAPAAGFLIFEGKYYSSFSISDAMNLGIRMIYQQVRLYKEFTVAENLFLSNKRINRPFWSRKRDFTQAAQQLLERYHFDIDPSTKVKQLNLSDQTAIEVLKHITPRPKLLILDEALERLSPLALHKVIDILGELKNQGTSMLFITHRIDDIYDFADRVSIFKHGEILVTDDLQNIDKLNLIKMAYTQLSSGQKIEEPNKEFQQYLKYNEAILRNLPVNLIVVDTDNRIKMVNDYCKQHFQLEAASYLNVPLAEFFSGENAALLDLFCEAFESGEGKSFYQRSIAIQGSATVNNIKTVPIYDESLQIGHILIIEDVTEYDHLQKQFMLSEKLASVGLLAAGVAHEINNPLGIINNYLSSIKYRFHEPALHEAIDDVQEEVTSIAHIVSNLHSFSDKRQVINEELDVNSLLRDMMNLIQHNAKRLSIDIRFEPGSENLQISANRNEVKQVLLNLFKNSFEAMPSGGEICIETSLNVEHPDQPMVQIRFHDTGPGICGEDPDDIFLPFYSTKKGQEENLGLGLSVSYGIIQKYQGAISVENTDSGCQFTINLPYIEDQPRVNANWHEEAQRNPL